VHWSDSIIFLAYLVGILWLGYRARGRDRSTGEYFLAGRSMSWVPVGLSVMVTAFSAVNYAALPSEVFGHGLYVLISLPVFVLVAAPITRVFMPFFYGMRLTSAYEYLERRFDARVRCLASGLFILWRLLWMATALYASGKILGAIAGVHPALVIIIGGMIATLYTSYGGMRAVMWTDVAQFIVLVGGIAVLLTLTATRSPASVIDLWRVATTGGRLKPFSPFDPEFFSFSPFVRITFWSGLIGTFVAFMARYGADQVVLQRYFSARSLRDAQRGFRLNITAVLVAISLLAILGLATYAHADATGALGQPGLPPMRHLANLLRTLPSGAVGLIAAGILAATMSSLDSGIHACTLAYVTDFHNRFVTPDEIKSPQDHSRQFAVWLTVALGILTIGLAFVVGRLGSVFVIANRIIHGLGSPLLAIILMGMFSRRANSRGVLVGGIVGILWSLWLSFGVDRLALHYYAVFNLLGALLACHVFSFSGAAPTRNQLAWTWKARSRDGSVPKETSSCG